MRSTCAALGRRPPARALVVLLAAAAVAAVVWRTRAARPGRWPIAPLQSPRLAGLTGGGGQEVPGDDEAPSEERIIHEGTHPHPHPHPHPQPPAQPGE